MIPRDWLTDLVSGRLTRGDYWALAEPLNIPRSATMLYMGLDPRTDSLYFVMEDPSFPECQPGERSEEHLVQWQIRAIPKPE